MMVKVVQILAALILLAHSPGYALETPDVTNPTVVEAFVDGV
jgi:hypothetical protein